jgi:hypothetical protein
VTSSPPLVQHVISVFVRCFGAQAALCGVLFATVRMNSFAYQLFAWCMIPFFMFDLYFYFGVPLFNELIFIDFIGNIGITVCCLQAKKALDDLRTAANILEVS